MGNLTVREGLGGFKQVTSKSDSRRPVRTILIIFKRKVFKATISLLAEALFQEKSLC